MSLQQQLNRGLDVTSQSLQVSSHFALSSLLASQFTVEMRLCAGLRPLDGDKEQMKCLLKFDYSISKAVEQAHVPKASVKKASSNTIKAPFHEQNAAHVDKPGHTQDPGHGDPSSNFLV